jgi:hypothetical protein
VLSCDPLYRWGAGEIRRRIDETYDMVLEQTRRNQDGFVWESIRSVDDLGRVRLAAMEEFLSDYPEGAAHGRYVDASLPALPFDDEEFDLAVCSHLCSCTAHSLERSSIGQRSRSWRGSQRRFGCSRS